MSLDSQITALTSAVQSNRQSIDDATRFKAIKAAQDLLAALGSPAETVIQDVVLNSVLLMALRMGVQLGVFTAIRDNQGQTTTTQQIADKSGASVVLVDQIMRLLTASGYVLEEDVQTYKPSPLTMVMAEQTFEATTRACFDIGNFCTTRAPEFFRKNNNQFPESAKNTPFQLAMNTELSYFEWLGQNPELARDFQQWMTLKQQATPNWFDWFDIRGSILDGFNSNSADNVLMVDVGGGEGHYLHALNEKLPSLPGRLVLQDLPHVVSSIENPPKGTELMPHDFFTPQPVKGARVYYMHWILHDWADEQARKILTNLVAAMEPGYSRLIINDYIIPDRDCDFPTACMSIMMMVQVGAFERSEKQWRELLNSVGLKDVIFHQPPGSGEGIIEAIKS
ncbi:sterigmatocystin 8-O-methyltransferase precursor [Aspergillus ibericus CBS 121593]|uniref:Sterigmatocystin 8-O-methyltransferase n=1 Tax=Aspergillus ibericus CBS 121593 TaxID=1448316 RepID=A0A395H5P1_9EURO|nr:sterigmatocystin 8-O-methyltransferase precursor [Aspergillus ibericus CBS 121593]RAL01564.1 sterigmatocystin 8-O-methyltransferase precursor [Aspergillus ibericus CBS 121593]